MMKTWKSAVNGVSRSCTTDELEVSSNRILVKESDASMTCCTHEETCDLSGVEFSTGIRLSCKISRAGNEGHRLVADDERAERHKSRDKVSSFLPSPPAPPRLSHLTILADISPGGL